VAKNQSKQHSQAQVSSTETKVAGNSFQKQLQELLNLKKYRQALEEIKKNQRTHPNIEFTPPESEIWLLRGQQEFEKQDFKQAEKSFTRALEFGLVGEVHYWQAKCLLELKQLDAALKLLKNAFEAGTLPKEYSICYLKLLFLKGDTATVEQLIQEQSKRFSAGQLHWVRGVLALKKGQPETAFTSFQKIKRAVTDGDLPLAWVAYTQQVSGNWDAAAHLLGLKSLSYGQPKYLEHPILERLAIFQYGRTEQKPFQSINSRTTVDKNSQQALAILRMLQFIDQGNHYDAAHVLLKMERRSPRFPELESLRPLLFTLAGQQALNQREPSCAELFWQPLLTEQPFNPQLAINLLKVFDVNDNDQERPRLLTRFLKWLDQEAKRKPQEWPAQRLKATQAHLHCWMADAYIAIDRSRAAFGSVQQAERICPTSPEVLGRKGLIEAAQENYPEAIALLTQSLESGCRYGEVYETLLECWHRLDNKQAFNEARRKFGKHFGDVNIEPEVETSPWVDALSTLSYPLFSRFVEAEDPTDPPIRACQIFVNSVQSPPNSGGRVSLDQKAAAQVWDTLLQRLAGEEQIPVLQAIIISIQLFAKREKGIAALISQYQQKLINLSIEHPEAKVANLVILAVKENSPKKLEYPVRFYLDTMPQPGNALANIQLQARRFGEIKTLVPFLDEALRREPQNPLLLLAKATTYDVDHPNYEQLKQQGFELARRLQDAKALQAFREEQAFVHDRETQSAMPDPDRFDNLDMSDMGDLLEGMIKKLFGDKMSPAEFERMLPELKKMMLNNMSDSSDDDDDDDDDDDEDGIDLDFLFRNSSPSKKRKSRKKAGFQELL
jgi:tetratricopeptide (TPR) repeat protein